MGSPNTSLHRAVIEQSRAQGWDLWELTPEHAGLEQVFVELTSGREASE